RQYAALQLDLAKAVLRHHLLRLFGDGCGIERFAVFIVTRVTRLTTTTAVLIKQIRRERHLIAHASAEQVTDRLVQRVADEVERSDLQRGVDACRQVAGILASDVFGLRTLGAGSAYLFDHGEQCGRYANGMADFNAWAQLDERSGDG